MRSGTSIFLALVLIISISLTLTSCNNEDKDIQLSNLNVSPAFVQYDHAVNISVVVFNPDSRSRTYNATCFVGSSVIGTKAVNLSARERQTITFEYTPGLIGTLNVAIGNLSTTFTAIDVIPLFDITYHVVTGSKITLNYSIGQSTCLYRELAIEREDSTVTLNINKAITNGTREVTFAGWTLPPIYIENFYQGLDVNLSTLFLGYGSPGLLYVQDGRGDVDISSMSSIGEDQMQANTCGDGEKDAAGSLLVEIWLQGQVDIVQTGETINLPLQLTFTTGNTTNIVSSSANEKLTGAVLTSSGVRFERDGGPVPYVGTKGTITTTGTGNCLGLTFGGLYLDLQVEIKLVLEPESIE